MIKIMKKMWRKFLEKVWRIETLKVIAAFLIPAIFVMFNIRALDNDSWYVLSEGREIVEHGVYFEDMLSMHEGLSITVQNYGFAVIFYWIYSLLGPAGIYLGMLMLNFAVCFLLYKICMLISGKNQNLSLLLMVLTDMLLAFIFVVTRAQMVSYVIFLLLIYLLELYVKKGKVRYLAFLPVLSFLQVNLHASLWWMLILVVGVYIVDSVRAPKLHLQGYKTKPLLVTLLLMVVFGLINPYGLKMITFIFTSYGQARFNELVYELHPFSPFMGIGYAFFYISLVAVIVFYIFGNQKNVRVRYLLMLFGFLALGLNTVKGLSQSILVMFFPLALMYKRVRIGEALEEKKARNALVGWTGAVAVAVFAVMCPMVVNGLQRYPSAVMAEAVDVIDANVAESERGETRVYTGYNDGGYLNYRGYKSYLDPRGEVYLKKNNGKEDILYEWQDFRDGKMSTDEMLSKYEFDFLVVAENDPFYKLERTDYKMIFDGDEAGVKVFKRVGE